YVIVWIAIASILLPVFAPIVSQSLQATRVSPAQGLSTELVAASHRHGNEEDTGGHDEHSHVHEACGYCAFFAHTPYISKAQFSVIPPQRRTAQTLDAQATANHGRKIPHALQQTRAPPLRFTFITYTSPPLVPLRV